MWIEINNLNLELYTKTAQKSAEQTPEKTAAELEPPVELTHSPSAEISSQLQKFQQKIHEAPMVNEHKVNALKQQISDRTYGILNPDVDIAKESALRMADKILGLENDLFSEKS